ncbi:MAG: OsmC family protein [Planctomycetota bacterium]
MAEHTATIKWVSRGEDFLSGKYSREHMWAFDGGAVVPASPAPAVVPAPYSNPDYVDPEEAFVASASSCHMLTFLHLAGRAGFRIEQYTDEAVGVVAKGDNGVPWVSMITLRPQISYAGDTTPTAEESKQLHHHAHEQCFIANSIKSEVVIKHA